METSQQFERALKAAVEKLEEAKNTSLLSDYALIGGLAASRWGYPRATGDIDFACDLKNENREKLANHLFAELRISSDFSDPLEATLSFVEGKIPVQLIQFPPNWTEVCFKETEIKVVGDVRVPIVSWQALLLLKLYAGGAIDLKDAISILQVVAPSDSELDSLMGVAERLRVSKRLMKLRGKI